MASVSGSVPENCSAGTHPAGLASERHCVERIRNKWPEFLAKRAQYMEQHRRLDGAYEKVTESILVALFTEVFDWPLGNVNYQMGRADIVLTDSLIRRLIVEAKRPGALTWNRKAVECALDQALRYASEQHVKIVAISDGKMLYAANVKDGGLRDRVYASLDQSEAPEELWWLSVHGIYREQEDVSGAQLRLQMVERVVAPAMAQAEGSAELLHPKYHVPARCFAYVGDYAKTSTWKLPYLLADGGVDEARLSAAVRSIVSNYRGTKVKKIPEEAIPAVLQRLAEAARSVGHMPPEASDPAPTYRQLSEVMEQFAGR